MNGIASTPLGIDNNRNNNTTGVNYVLGPIIRYIRQKITKHILRLKDSIMGQVATTRNNIHPKYDKTTPAASSDSPISLETNTTTSDDINDGKNTKVGMSPILALGAGCYWGTEKYVRTKFQEKFPNSIKDCAVGFMPISNTQERIVTPTYEQVCSGSSGYHVEVLYIELKNPEQHYEELIKYFFQFHDPTTFNRQGNDRGYQYASIIFCSDDTQYAIAEKVKNQLQTAIDKKLVNCFAEKKITTRITNTMTKFTSAEFYHQKYLEKNPFGYCNHRIRFRNWPTIDA